MRPTWQTVPALLVAASLSACASWTPAEKGTAIGATAGGALGHVITGGSALGTIGGAAAGGIVGHEVGKSREDR